MFIVAELYEISPYATFGATAAHSLQFRTLARRDDDAAPPHRRRRRCDHYRYGKSKRVGMHTHADMYASIQQGYSHAYLHMCTYLSRQNQRPMHTEA